MTDIKLPAGYEDWVARGGHQPLRPPYLRVTFERVNATGASGEVVEVRWLVPPKPKPTLPDVKPGAVLRYKDKSGIDNRAVLRCAEAWEVHAMISGRIYRFDYDDSEMLADVNADGFTVELDGL